jgi:hypothetical protein
VVNIILAPPLVFIIFLGISLGISGFANILSARGVESAGKLKSYACGEDFMINTSQPEYGQFFPFAFFFTIMHVVVLIIATVPSGITWLAALYLLVAFLALRILFRK